MSAGICIMNKNAIALAADSAVTIGQHLAIHNSANKLFALSKVAPIGVSFINGIGEELPRQIQSGVNSIDDTFFAENKKQSVQQELSRITSNVINQIVQKAQQQYLLPITQSVATLPIEELALLAESMINITSLRRKVALDNNIGTVGGPIDVAIISKCDGFIWLKRKHYFDRAYNPQYFYSHYMLSESEDINNGE